MFVVDNSQCYVDDSRNMKEHLMKMSKQIKSLHNKMDNLSLPTCSNITKMRK